MDDDRDLRERFLAARAEDERAAPSFAALLASAAARGGSRSRISRLVLAALAAALLLVLLPQPGRRPRPELEPSITEWRSPTDFLLRTPGREVLGAIPRFGGGGDPGWLPVERSPLP